MMSLVWLCQTAMKLAETDSFITRIMMAVCLLSVFMLINGEENIRTIIVSLLACSMLLNFNTLKSCLNFITSLVWNKTQCQNTDVVKKSKKVNKKKKELPVEVEAAKKKQTKKNKRGKKTVAKENKDTLTVPRETTKIYKSLDICSKLNMTQTSIYQHLRQFVLSEEELVSNQYPMENMYFPTNLVAANNSKRTCVRCGSNFEIYNGLYLSATRCAYHPRKAIYQALYPCCEAPFGSVPCTEAEKHVTLQHGPRELTPTSRKRHVKKDLQFRVFALDCEMSYTTAGLEVTRIGVVDHDGRTYYESFVKPTNEVLDYNTLYSGVSKEDLLNVTTTLDDVKRILSTFIFEDTILVGHALNNDLAALGLIHRTVIDTSVLYPDPVRPGRKRALKALTAEFLGSTIQAGNEGHNCIDDARASLQLALLKISHGAPERPLADVQNSPMAYYCGQYPTYGMPFQYYNYIPIARCK